MADDMATAQLKQYEEQLKIQKQDAQYRADAPYATAMFEGGQKQNLVEYELDFRDELVEIERFLRCDILGYDKDGNEVWKRNPKPEEIFLNDSGVSDLMREIRMFLNKNKVLSNYALDEIKPRIKMIGHELRMLVYNNYERYGIDNEYKMNNYAIIILTILSMIEDSFRRAINGATHKGVADITIVHQNEPLVGNQNNGMNSFNQNQPKKRSALLPWTWKMFN